jgi:hypothetical protein
VSPFDPEKHLVSTLIADAAEAPSDEAWTRAAEALAKTRPAEPELAGLVAARDAAALAGIVALWRSGKRPLPEQDREVLRRAMKAFRKSLKVTRLDAESSIGGGPMSSGRNSGIAGMRPPDRYPREVWEELAREKRLLSVGHGIYELPPE